MNSKLTKNNKKKTILSVLLIAAAFLLALIVGIAISSLKLVNASDDSPSIDLILLDENKITINASAPNLDDTNSIVFCLSPDSSSKNCAWQVENEFMLSKEGRYYVFVKDLRNSNISIPSLVDYKAIDYSQLRM